SSLFSFYFACLFSVSLSRILRPPLSTLFPYTTLFRSPFLSRFVSLMVFRDDLHHRLALPPLVKPLFLRTGFESALRTSNSVNRIDRKSTRLNSSHQIISYAVFCLKKKKNIKIKKRNIN